MLYENWQPTEECPTIEDQVIKDLLETNDISKEVIGELKGDPDKVRAQVTNIIHCYRVFAIGEYRHDVAQTMAEKVSGAMTPAISKWIEDLMKPVPANNYARAARMHRPDYPSQVNPKTLSAAQLDFQQEKGVQP